jgi:hypothetical protein
VIQPPESLYFKIFGLYILDSDNQDSSEGSYRGFERPLTVKSADAVACGCFRVATVSLEANGVAWQSRGTFKLAKPQIRKHRIRLLSCYDQENSKRYCR